MRKLFLGLGGIVGLGVAAVAVVLLLTRQPERAPEVARPAPAPPPARDAIEPPESSVPPLPVQGPQGPISLQLPPDAVARDLTAALPRCHRINAAGAGAPAVLDLELEARDGGGFVVVDARVASRGGASEGLLACASQALLGRRVAAGSFPPGERFVARYELMPPSQATAPAPEPPSADTSPEPPMAHTAPEPLSMPLPVTRQQQRRRGGSR